MAISNYDPGQELSSINFGGMLGGPLSAVVDAQAASALSTVNFIKQVGFTPDIIDEDTGLITEPGKPVYVSFKYPKMVAPYAPAVLGQVDTVALGTSGGTGYTAGDVLTIGAGSATVVVTTVDTDGAITALSSAPQSKGSGYSAGSGISVSGGSGSGALVNITIKDQDATSAVFEDMVLEVPILTMMPIPFIRVDYLEVDFHAKITSMEYRDTASKINASASLSITNVNEISGSGSVGKKGRLSGSVKNTNTVDLKVNASYQQSVKGGHKVDKTYQLGVKMRATQDDIPAGMSRLLDILEDAIVAQPAEAKPPTI